MPTSSSIPPSPDAASSPAPAERMKRCSVLKGCGQEKPVSGFRLKNTSPDGYDYICKDCANAKGKAKRAPDIVRRRQERADAYRTRTTKICSGCHVERAIEDFTRTTRSPDGHDWVCRICKKEQNVRAWERQRIDNWATAPAYTVYAAGAPTPFDAPLRRQPPPGQTTKECTRCGLTKPFAAFPERPAMLDGHDSWCHNCKNDQTRQRQKELMQHLLEHPEERIVVKEKRCGHCNIVRPAEMFVASKRTWGGLTNDCKVCRYAYAVAHPEERRIYDARSYVKNGHKQRLRGLRWRKNNPAKVKALAAKRRALECEAEGIFTVCDIEVLYAAQEGLCEYCLVPLLGIYDIEHMTPLSRGGSNWPSNLCCACENCNSRKHNKTAEEFRAILAAEHVMQREGCR